MVSPKARLALSATLFLAWIGFLVYLVVHTRDPMLRPGIQASVLSRPQLMDWAVVWMGEVNEKDARPAPAVTITKVAWNKAGEAATPTGSQLTIKGLADCGRGQGWQ